MVLVVQCTDSVLNPQVSPKPNTFMPFGNGTHSCPGNELAKLEILVLLHHLTTKYRLVNLIYNSLEKVFFLSCHKWGISFEYFSCWRGQFCLQMDSGGHKYWNPIWPFCPSDEWIAHQISPKVKRQVLDHNSQHVTFYLWKAKMMMKR